MQVDDAGAYVTAEVTCGGTAAAAYKDGPAALPWVDDLRIRSCPVAAAREAWGSAVHHAATALDGGPPLDAVGVHGLTVGGFDAVGVVLEARRWRSALLAEIATQRKAVTGGR